MDKKKILFIIPGLQIGGAEKSLVSLLQGFDYHLFNVDLLLLNSSGPLVQFLPKEVRLVGLSEEYRDFSCGIIESLCRLLRKNHFKLALYRLLFSWLVLKGKQVDLTEQLGWKYVRKAIGVLPGHYDVAIGYLEKTSIYCAVDNVSATRKIGFIRTDYSSLKLDRSEDKAYFKKLDYLCVNGYQSFEVLKSIFPDLVDKFRVVLNLFSPEFIRRLAAADIPCKDTDPLLLSIGRLQPVKGFDLAIQAAKLLKERGFKFRWLILGAGPERGNLEKLIKKYDVHDRVELLGEVLNPYPFLKKCEVYVQTSHFEGRSSTISEAKLICKPIVSTDFDSVYELLEHQVTGILVSKSASAIAIGIQTLLEDSNLRNHLINNLKGQKYDSDEQFLKFYELIQ